ncbi:MAG: hypothetical protein AVDCRST_MAG38-22, partial [uncultured Solirubrobacteraceae bacterium]
GGNHHRAADQGPQGHALAALVHREGTRRGRRLHVPARARSRRRGGGPALDRGRRRQPVRLAVGQQRRLLGHGSSGPDVRVARGREL